MALRASEDTEFNDALRARGIIPALPTAERSPSPPPLPTSLERLRDQGGDLSDEDLLDELEDDLPASVLDNYRQARMREYTAVKESWTYGHGLREIGRDDYTREVTEASRKHCKGHEEGGTGVVCFLYNDAVPESQLMRHHLELLAKRYPATKFVAIFGSRCIPNYPDKNIPTLLIYRKGEMTRQLVGLGERRMKTTARDIEGVLVASNAIDLDLQDSSISLGTEEEDQDSDRDSDM